MARYNVGKGKSGNDVFTLDKLVTNALREKHSGAMVVVTPQYKTYKSKFEKTLIGKARITKTDEKAQEISKIQVDVNEKIYTNRGSNNKGEDEGDDTKVLIVKRSKSSDAYSYEQQTTKGLEWGAGTNIGALFGLPQVGVGLSAGLNADFKKHKETTTKESTTKTKSVEQESHHEEAVEIPPGHVVKVTMTSYRVKYQLEYSMVYTVPKSACIRLRYNSGLLSGWFSRNSKLTAAQILRTLPEFKEDRDNVSFVQKGWLKWVADRMEVDKTVTPL